MPQEYLSNTCDLDMLITSLSIEISTADAKRAGTNDKVYCNIVFTDGSLLFNPKNFRLDTPGHNDFESGKTDPPYDLPIPEGLEKKIADIDEFYIRVSGSNGWLLGSALLFANGLDLPVIGNSEINQFLDTSKEVLFLRDWSTRSLISSSDIPAKYPLLSPKYRIAGPVLGQVSDTSANILYRVDREGQYLVRVFEAGSDPEVEVFEQDQTLSPTATFHVTDVKPNTHYKFRFFRLYLGQEIPQPDGDGEFRTFPTEGSGVNLKFAFASCVRNEENVAQAAWTGIKNLGDDPSVDPCTNSSNGVRFFIHLGDSFYFYDDVTTTPGWFGGGGNEPKNLRTVLAANLSARKHPRFLDMARTIPCCAVWDDHDFRKNDEDSVGFDAKSESLAGFLNYWGNDTLARADDPNETEDPLDQKLGLATRLSYGNVDLYIMDGRFERDKGNDVCFGPTQIDRILAEIDERARAVDRLVILASGSTWNHKNTGGDAYGGDNFDNEREVFYKKLNGRIGNQIKGLVFLSGDIHINEIFEIELPVGAVAPEFVSSPLGVNTSLKDDAGELEEERKWSVPSKGDEGKRGFATLEIDTTAAVPDGGWTIKVSYYDENASITSPYHTKEYTLSDGQFEFVD